MKDEVLVFGGKKFISSRRASKVSGYTLDYIGQLSRTGKLQSQMVGRSRFISETSLLTYIQSIKNVSSTFSSTSSERDVDKKGLKKFLNVNRALTFSITFILFSFFMSQPIARDGVNELMTLIKDQEIKYKAEVQVTDIFQETDKKLFYQLDKVDKLIFEVFHNAREKILTWLEREDTTVVVRSTSTSPNINTVTLENTNGLSEEDIRRAVRQVMLEEADIFVSGEKPQGGIVTIPSTGTVEGDEALKKKIRSAFSDDIKIAFDESRTAGIIRPVFRNSSDIEDIYLFVLVPVSH